MYMLKTFTRCPIKFLVFLPLGIFIIYFQINNWELALIFCKKKHSLFITALVHGEPNLKIMSN